MPYNMPFMPYNNNDNIIIVAKRYIDIPSADGISLSRATNQQKLYKYIVSAITTAKIIIFLLSQLQSSLPLVIKEDFNAFFEVCGFPSITNGLSQ